MFSISQRTLALKAKTSLSGERNALGVEIRSGFGRDDSMIKVHTEASCYPTHAQRARMNGPPGGIRCMSKKQVLPVGQDDKLYKEAATL
jgi:hypothetical protein